MTVTDDELFGVPELDDDHIQEGAADCVPADAEAQAYAPGEEDQEVSTVDIGEDAEVAEEVA